MRILIISDLHGNMNAIRALPEDFDEMWVLGDLVTYGPQPAEVVEFVRRRATLVVRGNHDNAAGTHSDPRCSDAFQNMARATLAYTDSQLDDGQRKYLADLPLLAERSVGGCRFMLCHATPSDPLFKYCPGVADLWRPEMSDVTADVLLVGHTHVPFVINFGRQMVVNPGSVGQPKQGEAKASCAVWEDGRIELRSYPYPVTETVRKVNAMPVPDEIRRDLVEVLLTGAVPARLGTKRSSHGCSDS